MDKGHCRYYIRAPPQFEEDGQLGQKGNLLFGQAYRWEKRLFDSREVAEMVEKRHDNLLRDIDGYIKIMEEANALKIEVVDNGLNFQPVEFFVPSAYQDNKGETRPCYLITRKGCDMIANKMNGKKGVLFTAAYVTAFEEMQMMLAAPRITALPEGVSLNGLARLLSVTRRIMLDMGSSPVEIGLMAKSLYEGCGIPLNPAFSKQLPGQTSLFDGPASHLLGAADSPNA